MHDNWLILIAMTTASLGIVGLLFALEFLEIPTTNIEQTAAMADGTPARISGNVIASRIAGGMTIITITQPAQMDVVIEQNITKPKTGDCIVAYGKKGSYNGRAQLTATMFAKCTTK